MTWSRLDLGVGIIALGSLDHLWPGIADLVDVVEVEPQTLWVSALAGGQHIAAEPLDWLRGCGRPLLAHGVGFPVGGTQAPDRERKSPAPTSAQHAEHSQPQPRAMAYEPRPGRPATWARCTGANT